MDDLIVRPAVPEDLGYIIDSWLRTMRVDYGAMDDDHYWTWMKPKIKRILVNADTHVCVTCSSDDPSTIIGWVATTDNKFVYWGVVRSTFRKMGLVKQMTAGMNIQGIMMGLGHTKLAWRPDLVDGA